ncbi:TonB-dependent receptor [Dysgonomonas macrotermitis]|uniref:TonB dependent receptor n=1 Tax=Dysgonomonas macrotermitis TaxID=1346286 RepID=A0A1M5CX45_9BACT|nr:TonB-dependent receptor [Dysgonomonas macrotermitis]SHF59274.1 hypothetical protein SAMN05444362_1087 [Dysgonomonas macrotermitis]
MNINTSYKLIISAAIAICPAIIANAQTSAKDTLLNRQVSLEREYNPTIQDASKINSLPAVHQPLKKQYDIRFENAAPTIKLSAYPIGDTGSGSIRTKIEYPEQRGYLNFGAGMYSNLEGALGYRIVDSANDQFDLFGTHNSTNGKIKYLNGENNDEVKAKNMENFIKAKYSHKFGSGIWNLSASFLNNSFNYYGKPYILNYEVLPSADIYNMEKNQVVNIFDINTSLISKESYDELNYSASIRYNRFTTKYSTNIEDDGPSGNIFDAKVDLSQPFFGDKKIGIKGGLLFQKYDEHSTLYESDLMTDLYHNLTVVRANPYFKIDDGDIRFTIGANINWAIDVKNKFAIAPTVDLAWNFDETSLLYLTVDGGINDNNFVNIYNENRYIAPIGRVNISKTLYDAQLGVRSGVIQGFEFDIFGGYKQTKDEHLYLPTSGTSWSNVSQAIYANLGEGHFGGAIKTKLIPYTDLSLKAIAHFYSLDKYTENVSITEKKAWGLPTFTVDFNADFSFIENLILTANYQFSGGRKTTNYLEVVDMKNINELNVKASYHVLKWLSLYAKANNVLNQKYERYYGYTLQGINITGGFNLIF